MSSVSTTRWTRHACEVQGLARALLLAYGLRDWSFAFNRRKQEMGLCRFDDKCIELSLHFIERNPDEAIRDTLLHEIAHALVGPGHGHDRLWKQKCREIGARPERVCHEVNMPEGSWQATCGNCGMVHHRHRRPKHLIGWHCRHCGRVRGRLTWQRSSQSRNPSSPGNRVSGN
jgi:predicted SprT family Zn-dependent metalloprotease